MSMRAASVYQRVLTEQALTFDAVRVCEERLAADELSGDTQREMTSRCRLAVALHRDGQCDLAGAQVRAVLRRWYASPHSYGHAEMVLLAAAGVHAGCGRTGEAVQVLIRDGAYLAHLDAACRQLAAGWLATVVRTHPGWCGAPRDPDRRHTTLGSEREGWLAVLDRCASMPPAGGSARVRRRGSA